MTKRLLLVPFALFLAAAPAIAGGSSTPAVGTAAHEAQLNSVPAAAP